MPGRDSKDRTWTHGQRDSTLRNHRLDQKRNNYWFEPNQEQVRQWIKEGYCGWCNTGGWKSLSLHTHTTHGINADMLRNYAGLFTGEPTCTESLSHKFAVISKQTNNIEHIHHARGKHLLDKRKKNKSKNNKAFIDYKYGPLTQRLLSFSTPEQRDIAREKAHQLNKKGHNCPACGKYLPTATPITCSPECRKIIRQLTAEKSHQIMRQRKSENSHVYDGMRNKQRVSLTKRNAEGKMNSPNPAKPHPCPVCGKIIPKAQPKACSLECRHILLQAAAKKGQIIKNLLDQQDPNRIEARNKKISLGKGGRINQVCIVCGKIIYQIPRWLNKKVCSNDCLLELRRKNAIENNVSKRPEVQEKMKEWGKVNYIKRQRLPNGTFAGIR